MYVFVFQMLKLRITLESEAAEDMAVKKRKLKARIILVTICFTVHVISNILVQIFVFYSLFNTTKEVLNIIRCISKLAIDIYMFSSFYSTFKFFVALKREN